MESKKFLSPIVISEREGKIQISYDQTSVGIPLDGPIPKGTPALACRIFEVFIRDLPARMRAE